MSKLTDLAIRNAKPQAKPYLLFDREGLYVRVAPSGVKSWLLRYRLLGKEKIATLGRFDLLSLKEARDKANQQRKLVSQGVDLTLHKQQERKEREVAASHTFKHFASRWIEREGRRQAWSDNHKAQVAASLGLHLEGKERRIESPHLSRIHDIPLDKLTAKIIRPELDRIEDSAPLMLEKIRPRLRAILDDAVEHGLLTANPLPPPRRRASKAARKHYPAITDLAGVGMVLRSARASDPCKGIQRAHLLLAFTGMRVSEVVGAKWEEFALKGVQVPIGSGHATKLDPNAGNWSIPRERMKQHKDAARGPHVAPLPPVLLSQLREWREADGDKAVWVCPAPRDPNAYITPEAVEKHYRTALGLAGRHSPHSWRSAFKSICADAGKNTEAVEAQLDHIVGNKVASAYDRAQRLELRRELMAWYEATLTAARDGATVHALPSRRPKQ